MILSILFCKDTFNAVIFDGKKIFSSIKNTDIKGLDGFISSNKKSITKAVVLLSDYYNEYFINAFENAEEDDIDKAVAFKIKDLIANPPNKSVIASRTIKQSGKSIQVLSAVSPLTIVAKIEGLMSRHRITDYATVPVSLSLLTLLTEANYAQLINIDEITTTLFIAENSITYIRKIPVSSSLQATFKFYNEKYKFPVKVVFTNESQRKDVFGIPVKNIITENLVATTNEETVLIGAALCL